MQIRDIYNHHRFMRFKELRDYYAMLRRRQKIWYSIPFIVGFGGILISAISVYATFTAQIISTALTGMIANQTIDMAIWISFMLSAVVLPVEHTERYLAAPVFMFGVTVIPFALFGSLPVAGLVMVCYDLMAAVLMKPIAEQVLFMKELPDYPFLERVETDRMRYERTLLYTESANRTLAKEKFEGKRPHEEYDGTEEQQEELLASLPKRHNEDFYIRHGEFDAPEEDYTNDLSTEDVSRPRVREDFAEPDEVFNDLDMKRSPDEEYADDPQIDEIKGRHEDIKRLESKS